MYNNTSTQLKKLLIILVIGLILVFAGLTIYRNMGFRITSTDPNLSSVSVSAAYIRLSLNKPLSNHDFKISLPGGLISKTELKDNSIFLYLDSGLKSGTKYSFTIDHLESTSGSVISHKKVNIQLSNIPPDQLSGEQQKALVSLQDQPKNDLAGLPFSNFDILTDQGLTTSHLNIVRQSLFSYSQVIRQQFNTLTLNQDSIKTLAYDKNSPNPVATVSFVVLANNEPLTVNVAMTDLNNATVTIVNQGSQVVYNSATPFNY